MPPAIRIAAAIAGAAGIAVLTNAEPGVSSSGTAIWHCTYVVGTRETTVTLDTACPASLDVE